MSVRKWWAAGMASTLLSQAAGCSLDSFCVRQGATLPLHSTSWVTAPIDRSAAAMSRPPIYRAKDLWADYCANGTNICDCDSAAFLPRSGLAVPPVPRPVAKPAPSASPHGHEAPSFKPTPARSPYKVSPITPDDPPPSPAPSDLPPAKRAPVYHPEPPLEKLAPAISPPHEVQIPNVEQGDLQKINPAATPRDLSAESPPKETTIEAPASPAAPDNPLPREIPAAEQANDLPAPGELRIVDEERAKEPAADPAPPPVLQAPQPAIDPPKIETPKVDPPKVETPSKPPLPPNDFPELTLVDPESIETAPAAELRILDEVAPGEGAASLQDKPADPPVQPPTRKPAPKNSLPWETPDGDLDRSARSLWPERQSSVRFLRPEISGPR